MHPSLRPSTLAATLSLALLGTPLAVQAQTATLKGTLSQFDVVNEIGQDAHGFEIQLEGATQTDLFSAGYGQQYGTGTVVPYATGVRVRWASPYDALAGQYTKRTPQHTPGVPYSWNDCYLPGATYAYAGCESLGQGLLPTTNPVVATGRWLIDDPQNPGTLIGAEPNVAIPFPSWSVAPGGVAGSSPVVTAEVEAPEAPESPELYGEAQWVKVYKNQLTREVAPGELTSDNTAVVPQDPSQLETAWDILQAEPATGGNPKRHQNQGGINPDTRSIIRRYETYKFTGTYDAITHKALCADGLCAAPAPDEVGDFIAAQISAVNFSPDSLIVAKTGSGSVFAADKKVLNCGSSCSAFAPRGTVITLTASANSGSVFTGWTGACAGASPTCAVTVSGPVNVGAEFRTLFTLSLGRSKTGTVTGTPAGTDLALNCGIDCSAKFAQGTAVTLTATPAAGKQFLNWTGACSGTNPVCTVFMNQNASVQAVFSK